MDEQRAATREQEVASGKRVEARHKLAPAIIPNGEAVGVIQEASREPIRHGSAVRPQLDARTDVLVSVLFRRRDKTVALDDGHAQGARLWIAVNVGNTVAAEDCGKVCRPQDSVERLSVRSHVARPSCKCGLNTALYRGGLIEVETERFRIDLGIKLKPPADDTFAFRVQYSPDKARTHVEIARAETEQELIFVAVITRACRECEPRVKRERLHACPVARIPDPGEQLVAVVLHLTANLGNDTLDGHLPRRGAVQCRAYFAQDAHQ